MNFLDCTSWKYTSWNSATEIFTFCQNVSHASADRLEDLSLRVSCRKE